MHFSTPILLADDDDTSRQVLSRSLEKAGFPVIQCRSGHEALARIAGGDPMLLVLDYDMPDFTGAQVCERVRGNRDPIIATLPIILLTGHSGPEHEVECLEAGADDFVTKPVNISTLKARLETQLRLHSLRAQLREQNTELERWRTAHEFDLDAARTTQRAILPARRPTIAGWEIAAHYQPLIQVGGDIYDWVRLPNGNWLAWIADATGHGAAAALLTTLAKLVFHHAAAEHDDACKILEAVNADVYAVFRGRSFITAACVVISPNSGEVDFAGAGHPPLLIVRNDASIESLRSQAPPVGIRANLECQLTRLTLAPGETLLLYTDGIYSLKDATGERQVPESVHALLPKDAASAEDFARRTAEAVNLQVGAESLPDDLALVALRRS